MINNAINYQKLNQVYLFSSDTINDFDECLLFFINQINKENFYTLGDIDFGSLYFLINGEDKNIAKEDLVKIQSELEIAPLENNKRKILIIKNIENGTEKSLSSLLKFLEEPPKNTIILMTSVNKKDVLKTIKSRAFNIDIFAEDSELLKQADVDNFIDLYQNEYIFETTKLKKSFMKLKT
ncbi:hypothetical protein [Mycoplasma struthionis]|uniref:DNA polymerase III subunit delta n=1 Tax=Mycoplasma struthionis TaxID=538220 RepID=A0A3G8LJ80_9MOLU|nr:hypothetical protein EGN60_03150 [Mycoplasma struthionis]